MDHDPSAIVHTDPGRGYMSLLVTGCLTEASLQALYPLIREARMLAPPVSLTVNLTAAEHVDQAAVDLLRWTLKHDATMDGAIPVEILLPDELPNHHLAPIRMTRHLRGSGWFPT